MVRWLRSCDSLKKKKPFKLAPSEFSTERECVYVCVWVCACESRALISHYTSWMENKIMALGVGKIG